VAAESEALEARLSPLLPRDWPLERLERTLRATLRAAAYELSHLIDVPARVVIAEYVDVADALCGERAPAMVNAVLDRLARELRPSEFATADEPGQSGAAAGSGA
ncbi:MAG: transcription antitermination factor NusB, partial [Acidobacteriota bacterium]